MEIALLLVSMAAVVLAATATSDRLRVPAPLLLVAVGAAASYVPGVPTIHLESEVVLLGLLPPLLYAAAIQTSLVDFNANRGTILRLSILLVVVTALSVAVVVEWLVPDLGWAAAIAIGAVVAPPDAVAATAVARRIGLPRRVVTILEGESGFNDPVGIALMIGMIELATHDDASGWSVLWEFLREMGIGLAVGVAGAAAIAAVIRWAPFPDRILYPVAVILMVGTIYGAATVARGSGFLAVFVAGILVGDIRFEARRAVRVFNAALGELGELATFVALGLTVDLAFIGDEGLWWRGLLIAGLLGFVVRPLVVGPLVMIVELTWGERGFIVWSGLKGAVPILLASLAVVASTEYAAQTYGIVFVVVLFSVVVQGSLVPTVARRLGVPLEDAPPPAPAAQ